MPRFRFRGDMPFEKWQSAARDRLKSLLCMPQNRGECRVDALTRKLHDGFIEYRFQVETEYNFYTQCYLLTPDDKKEAHKLCICFGGHGSNMHITAGLPDNDVNRAKGELCALENKRILSENPELGMAKFALEAGRAALVIESRGFGEAGDDEPSCTENAKTALLMGRTLMGERVHDAVCVLDAVLKEFSIDKEEIIATGYSGGGTLALYFAAVDERIAICAPSSCFCSFERSIVDISHCLCNHIPGIRLDFEIGDLAGLIYPRELIIAAGESDPIFPYEGVIESYELALKKYYAEDKSKISLLTSPKGHLYYAELIWNEIYSKNNRK